VNSLPKTVTRQRRDCDVNPGPSAPESSTLTTRLPSHPDYIQLCCIIQCCPAWQLVSCTSDCCVCRQLVNVDCYYDSNLFTARFHFGLVEKLAGCHQQGEH